MVSNPLLYLAWAKLDILPFPWGNMTKLAEIKSGIAPMAEPLEKLMVGMHQLHLPPPGATRMAGSEEIEMDWSLASHLDQIMSPLLWWNGLPMLEKPELSYLRSLMGSNQSLEELFIQYNLGLNLHPKAIQLPDRKVESLIRFFSGQQYHGFHHFLNDKIQYWIF